MISRAVAPRALVLGIGRVVLVAVVLQAAGCGGAPTPSRLGAARARGDLTVRRPPSERVQRLVLGRSVKGRPIRAVAIAAGRVRRTVLVIGCIHGNERAGIAIARRLLEAKPPHGSALWVVPVLNPDGARADTRQNADGVDLNRNFPWHWRPLGSHGDLQYSGSAPLSEPESRAARTLILRIRPQITIWFHQPLGVVDLSGGDPAVERAFAGLVGLPAQRLTRYPGSAVSWGNSVLPGSTAFVVELAPGTLAQRAVARYVHAILVIADPARPLPG